MEVSSRATGCKVFGFLVFILGCLGLLTLACGLALFLALLLPSRDLRFSALGPTPTLDLACDNSECLQVCLDQLPDLINQPGSQALVEPAGEIENEIELARYKVSSDRLSLKRLVFPTVPENLKKYQEDLALHQRIWSYYRQIFPERQKLTIDYVIFYTDGPGQSAASIRDLDHSWRLKIDLQDFDDQYDTTQILVHEYGHMLTLNDTQVYQPEWFYFKEWNRADFDKLGQGCQFFFTGLYCATSSSYLNQFGERFWAGEVYDEWVNTVFLPRATSAPEADQLVERFYARYPDQFITEYAATNPLEDLAESWEAFVLGPQPTDTTIAGQKVLFYSEFSEAVELRAQILRGICNYAAQPVK